MGQWKFDLPTIAGTLILGVILFMLITYIATQYIPSFKGINLGVGVMFIFLGLAVLTATFIIKKEFSFSKAEILPLILMILIFGALIYFYPQLMKDSMFQQSAIQLHSVFSP